MPLCRTSSFGLPLLLFGCANLIGLSGYSVDETNEDTTGDGDNPVGDGDGGDDPVGDGDGDGAGGVGGSVAATGGRDLGGSCESACEDENPCTDDSCQEGRCAFEPLEAGTPCGDGVCGEGSPPACVRCMDDEPSGQDVDTGCTTGAPECVRVDGEPRCVGCQSEEDCGAGGECTVMKCEAGVCVEHRADQGVECSDGVCDGGVCVECTEDEDCDGGHCSEGACRECTEDEHCGALFCVSGSCVSCREDGDCAAGICAGDGRCVGCVDAEDCDDGVECTRDLCTDEACSHTPDGSLCPDSGDVCLRNVCDESLGCQTEDIRRQEVLIDQGVGDGSFEVDDGSWDEFGSDFIIFEDPAQGVNDGTLASHGEWYAWFGGLHGEDAGGIRQLIDLPEGTTTLSLVANASFQTEQRSGNDDSIRFQITDLANNELLLLGDFSAEDATDDGSIAWVFDGVNLTGDASDLAGRSNVRLRIVSRTDDAYYTDFFVDDVRLTATVCLP